MMKPISSVLNIPKNLFHSPPLNKVESSTQLKETNQNFSQKIKNDFILKKN